MKKITGKWLNKKYGIGASQARYRENGVWYHPLKDFPGALFDGDGYVLFSSEAEYLGAATIKHGPDPNHIHAIDGIAKANGYVALHPAPRDLKGI
jgi:5-methylcytosine-specific restriction protein A